MTNYFDVSFSYDHGPGCCVTAGNAEVMVSVQFSLSEHEEREESRALSEAEHEVRRKLDESGLLWAHAYSFPDGSLYKYVATDMAKNELAATLDGLFGGGASARGVRIECVYDCKPTDDPYKVGCNTLSEYMELVRVQREMRAK